MTILRAGFALLYGVHPAPNLPTAGPELTTIGEISTGDTGDMSPAAKTLQGTTNVSVPCTNLRISSKLGVNSLFCLQNGLKTPKKGANFCAFGAYNLLNAQQIFATALLSPQNSKRGNFFTPWRNFVPCKPTAGIAPMLTTTCFWNHL